MPNAADGKSMPPLMQNSDFLSRGEFKTKLFIHLESDDKTTKGFRPFMVVKAEVSSEGCNDDIMRNSEHQSLRARPNEFFEQCRRTIRQGSHAWFGFSLDVFPKEAHGSIIIQTLQLAAHNL